jgi:hypothetical protein
MGEDHSSMYNERKGSLFTPVWKAGLDTFLDHAFSLPEAAIDGRSKCACTKCDCRHKRKRDEMEMHLCRNGFQLGYERWTRHGESDVNDKADSEYVGSSDRMSEMLAVFRSQVGVTGSAPAATVFLPEHCSSFCFVV